jgi:PAS domain S-box-containing protein
MHPPREFSTLQDQEIHEIRQRLAEAEEALRAIGSGEVDGLVIETAEGNRIYTLQDSEHAYRVMVETMSEGAATLLEDSTILYCNSRLAEMLGKPLEQMLGACFIDFIEPEEKEKFSSLLAQAVISEARAEMNLMAGGKGNLPALLSLRATPIQDQNPAACLIVTGLEEQKRSREELEARVAERTAELAQRNRDLEDFASVISHDLQEPLRKVQKFGDLLARNPSEHFSQNELDYIRRMQEATVRMSQMIEGLLDLARVSTHASQHQKVDLNQVVQEVLAIFDTRIDRNGGKVEVGDLPVIEAEPLQMQRLFQNLIGNAIKFQRPGVAPHVRVFFQEIPGFDPRVPQVQIRVEDNGIGFEETQAESLFQPFKRLVNRQQYDGTGIGLAICKKIVQRHGGQISAKSTPGRGSTFIVVLPVKQR